MMLAFTRFFRSSRHWALRLGAATLLLSSTVLADGNAYRGVQYSEPGREGTGVARVLVKAQPTVLRSVVTDFEKYENYITRFQSAKIVGKVGDKTDVYLKVPILQGSVKIWAVVRFDPPKKEGADEVIIGRMVKGNVKRLDARWRIRRVDDQDSELKLELTIVPDLPVPVPNSLVVDEVLSAAGKAVRGMRNEAERRTTAS